MHVEKPPVKIEFISYLKKTEILKQTKKLKGTGIAISHDLTFKQRHEQKILKTFLNRARENPSDHSYIKRNKLYVNSKAYTVEELQEISYSEERSEEHNTYSAPATPNIQKRTRSNGRYCTIPEKYCRTEKKIVS
ncbi:hypothetical protein JTB14_028842 [Gonioctena quinquepunctata]|nr:hypothetical protein JTB14_028842 [Gonioctena quinquepunctata]